MVEEKLVRPRRQTNLTPLLSGGRLEFMTMNGTRSRPLFTSILSSPSAYWFISIELHECGLQSAEILEMCVNLKSVYLPKNRITAVPKCITKLTKLKIMDLRNNEINDYEDGLRYLRFSPHALEVLILTGNGVAGHPHYRLTLYDMAPHLTVLDAHLLTSFERHPVLKDYYTPPLVPLMLRQYTTLRTVHVKRVVDLQLLFIHRIDRRAKGCFNSLLEGLRRFSYNSRLKKLLPYIVVLQGRARGFMKRRRLRWRLRAWCDEAELDYGDEFDDENANKFDERRARREYYSVKIQRAVRELLMWRKNDDAVRKIQRTFRHHMVLWNRMHHWLNSHHVKSFYLVSTCHPELEERIQYLRDQNWDFPSLMLEEVSSFVEYKTITRDEFGRTNAHCLFVTLPGTGVLQRMATPLWNLYAAPDVGRLLKRFPRRGFYVSGRVRRQWKEHMDGYSSNFKNKFSSILRVSCDDIVALHMLFSAVSTCIRHMPPGIARPTLPRWDLNVHLDLAVLVMQRMYRGYMMRRNMMTQFLRNLLANRAVRILQHWWRFRVGLHQRLQMLSYVAQMCRSITSRTVFMDAWSFYTLIRRELLPVPPFSARIYPEHAGFPGIDSAGHVAFFAPMAMHGRLGGSRWAYPIPLQRASGDLGPRAQRRYLARDVLVGGKCTVGVRVARALVPEGADEVTMRRLGRLTYRIIQIDYPSVKEAKARVAAIANLTYDSRTGTAAAPIALKMLLGRLDAVQRDLTNAFHGSVAHTVESTVGLAGVAPQIVHEYPKETNDLARFRFLLETLMANMQAMAKETAGMGLTSRSQVEGEGTRSIFSTKVSPRSMENQVPSTMASSATVASTLSPRGRNAHVMWRSTDAPSGWTLGDTKGDAGVGQDMVPLLADDSFAVTPSLQTSMEVGASLLPRGASLVAENPRDAKGRDFYLPAVPTTESSEAIDRNLCARHVWGPLKAVMWCSTADSVAPARTFSSVPGREEDYSHTLLLSGSGGGAMPTRLQVLQSARDAAERKANVSAKEFERRLILEAERQERAYKSFRLSQMEGERNELVERELLVDLSLSARERHVLDKKAKVARLKVERADALERGRAAQEAELRARVASRREGRGGDEDTGAMKANTRTRAAQEVHSVVLATAGALSRYDSHQHMNEALNRQVGRVESGPIPDVPSGIVSAVGVHVAGGLDLEASLEGSNSMLRITESSDKDMDTNTGSDDGNTAPGKPKRSIVKTKSDEKFSHSNRSLSQAVPSIPTADRTANNSLINDSLLDEDAIPQTSSRARASHASLVEARNAERAKRANDIRRKVQKKRRTAQRKAEAVAFGKAQGKSFASVARRMETVAIQTQIRTAQEKMQEKNRDSSRQTSPRMLVASPRDVRGDGGSDKAFDLTDDIRGLLTPNGMLSPRSPRGGRSRSQQSPDLRQALVSQRILKLKIDSELRIPTANMVSLANLYMGSASDIDDMSMPTQEDLLRSLSIHLDNNNEADFPSIPPSRAGNTGN